MKAIPFVNRHFRRIAAVVLCVLFGCVSLYAQNRYALIIGNEEYQSISALNNPVNDARDVEAKMKTLGYDVELKLNAGLYEMIDAIDSYTAKLSSSTSNEGFFWFAGHGIQMESENYLLPVDVQTASESRVKAGSYSLNSLLDMLSRARNKVNVVVLDACRNNPFPVGSFRSVSRGLAVLNDLPNDLFVMFSTAPGDVAADGDRGERNSPFAEAFLKYADSIEPLVLVATDITRETAVLTGGKQQPFHRGSFLSEKYYTLSGQDIPAKEAPKGDMASNRYALVIGNSDYRNAYGTTRQVVIGGNSGRGLTALARPTSMYIVYSTVPGAAASDGAEGKRNSPFTEAFLMNMQKPIILEEMIKDVVNDTIRLGEGQRPYTEGSILISNYSLNPKALMRMR
jgi:hypothetical protein